MKRQSHGKKILMTLLLTVFVSGCDLIRLTSTTAGTIREVPAQVAATARLKAYYDWINAPWTADDRPYQRLRNEIEQRLAHGQQPAEVQALYRSRAKQYPSDPKSQFAFYYATYKSATAPGNVGDPMTQQTLNNLYIKIGVNKLPVTYNYVRLVFLCGMYGFSNPKMKDIGLRLVSRDPSDYDAKFYVTSLLNTSPVAADQALALAYAEDLAQRYPKKPSAYSLLASVHYQAWRRDKNPLEGEEAISGYQQYLQLSPGSYEFRKRAQEAIAEIRKG